MDGAQSIEARFRSLDQKYILCNFHCPDDLDRAKAFLSAEDEPKALLLSGERGGGRSYFLESVVYRLHQAGRKIDLISIDLDGCETAPASLGDAISQEANKNQQGGTLLPTAKLVFKVPLDSLLSLVMIQFEWSTDKLAAFFRAEPQEILGPKRRERDRFHRLLEKLCEGEIGVLHILDSAKLTVPLRQWILAEVQLIPNLKVVFSCHPSEATEAVAPEISNLRIEFGPYDKRACLEVINQRLTPNTFPEGLLDALWRSNQGLPGYLALKILDLVSANLLFRDVGEIWRVAGYSLSDEAFVQEFTSDFHESVERVLNTQDATTKKRLRDFLHLAALCGENAPADLIFQYLRIDGEDRDMLVDLIDEHWVGEHRDAFLIDHEYAHPSFPAHAVYSFINPLYPPVLLRDVPARRQRAELATGFLTFLQKALPIQTRGIAHLFLELSRNLDDVPTRARYETMIAWWIDVEDAETLTRHLAHELQERRLNHDILWQAARMNQTLWPPYRRLALLDALEQQEQGVPMEQMGLFLNEKGLVLYEMGQYADAEALLRRALAIDERSYGPDHPNVATDLHYLARVLHDTNRLTDAEALYRRALAIHERSYGPDHPDVADDLHHLARLLHDTNRLAEAEPLYRRTLVTALNLAKQPDMSTGFCLFERALATTELSSKNWN